MTEKASYESIVKIFLFLVSYISSEKCLHYIIVDLSGVIMPEGLYYGIAIRVIYQYAIKLAGQWRVMALWLLLYKHQ